MARHDVLLRQPYKCIAKQAAMMAGREVHAKHFERTNKRIKLLRTRSGRVVRDIRRKIGGGEELRTVFGVPLSKAAQIRGQKQRQGGWNHCSWYAPEDRVHRQGQAHRPYEFGL